MFKKTLKKPDGRTLNLYSRNPIPEGIVATNPNHEDINATPHMRWHPLRQEWVIYASHRQNRTFLPPKDYSPLAISTMKDFPTEMPQGNYEMAVFENLFPSMNFNTAAAPKLGVDTKPSTGICEVVVFTQDPDSSLGDLPLSRVHLVLQVWADRTKELGAKDVIEFVMPFENRGIEMGVTLHHPHGQIYAYSFIPPVQALIMKSMSDFYQKNKKSLLEDMIQTESREGTRVLFETEHAIAFIPVCARYPYETWIAPKKSTAFLHELTKEQMHDLALVLKTVLMKFDKMWDKPFPYLMTLFQAPTDGAAHPDKHLHFLITPPYRTKDRLKFLAGTELGAGVFVNDSLPEEKAAELKAINVEVPNE